MEDTRRAIREGRILAIRGLYERAKTMWKATLSDSYSMRDYAGMFVLSVNIGEVCIWIAAQSPATAQALLQLQEANENLEYALQVVEKCSLCNVLAGHGALYQGVQRAKTLRRKAKELLDKLKQIEEDQKAIIPKQFVHMCTTCGVGDGNMLLDENDGCYYCRKCYDEYYATVEKDTSSETAEEVSAVQAVDELKKEEKNVSIAELALDEKRGDDSVDLVAIEASSTVEPVEGTCVYSGSAFSISSVSEEASIKYTEKAEPDRTRFERVELGSLADFLAGTLKVEDTVKQPQVQHNDIRNDSLELVAADPAEQEMCIKEPNATTGDLQEVPNDAISATSGDPCEEGIGLLNENTEDKAREKCRYSIAKLLELRKLSSCDCPEPLLASPVRDDGSTLTSARNKVNNSRKKLNPKKPISSAASHKSNNTDITGVPEDFDATLSISPLPTMDLCNTLRMALEEERLKDDGDTLRWPLSL